MTTPVVVDLHLPFLGTRTYLHGTTLLDALVPLMPESTDLAFGIPRALLTDRVRVEHGPSEDRPPHAILRGAGGHRLEVHPLEPSSLIERVAYDEALVTSRAVVTDAAARLEAPAPFSFIATVIPLHKALLAREATPSGPGQWLFTGVQLTHVPAGWASLEVRRERLLPGRMARSGLVVDGARIGHVDFAWTTTTPGVHP